PQLRRHTITRGMRTRKSWPRPRRVERGTAHMLILRGHEGPVRCLVYSPDGRLLASGSDDGKVKLWHLHTLQEGRTLTVNRLEDWVHSMTCAPDGTMLAAGDWNGWIRLWYFNSDGHLLRGGKGRLVPGVRRYVPWSMTFSPNCLSLAVGRC